MKINHICLENYGPFFGPHVFRFADRGLVLVQGDNKDEPRMNSNGSGKSTIFDALDWALFGVVPRGDHVDSVRNEEAALCTVAVELVADDGQPVTVRRSRGRSTTVQLTVGSHGQDLTALDARETQNRIDSILGLDRDVFHAAVLFAQGDLTHYAESGDAARMAILTKILRLDEVDVYFEAAKAKAKAVEAENIALVAKIGEDRSFLKDHEAFDFTAAIADWEVKRQGEIAGLAGMISRQATDLTALEAEARELPAARDRHLDLSAQMSALLATVPDDAAVRQAGERERAAHMQLVTLGAPRKLLAEQLDKMERLGIGMCPTCRQPITPDHKAVEVLTLRAQLQDLDDRIADADREYREIATEVGRLAQVYQATRQEFEAAQRALYAELMAVESKIKALGALAPRMDAIRVEMNRIAGMVKAKQAEVNPYQERAEHHRKVTDDTRATIADGEARIAALAERAEYIDFWVQALGAKGLKSYILDTRLQELSDAANYWVGLLTGGTIWVQFEAQKATRSGKTVNAPDLRICRWNPDGTITARNFASWSGGEKQRISFAVDFGLSRLLAGRASQKYDLLILDEVFKHLDKAGREAVMDLLQIMAREKSSVIVVEHDTDFQAMFDARVTVRKKGRRSEILEENNAA